MMIVSSYCALTESKDWRNAQQRAFFYMNGEIPPQILGKLKCRQCHIYRWARHVEDLLLSALID